MKSYRTNKFVKPKSALQFIELVTTYQINKINEA